MPVLVASLAMFSIACSGIRVVQRTQHGGVVALEGSRDGATEKAMQYMSTHCPKGYDIVEEGEAVVGQDFQSSSRPVRGLFGPATATSGSSTDKREWRIKYACKDAPAAQGSLGSERRTVHELIVRF
jgi:hypothetical protein